MDSSEESRTRASLDALAQKLSEAARQELGALRTAFDQRISASQTAVGDADHSKLLEAVARDLSRVAAEQAEAAATRVRADVQSVADRKLAAVQTEVRSRLEAEAAANAMLRDGLEETRRQLEESRASITTVENARAAIEAKYQEMVAHNKKLTDAVAEMQREVDHARQDAASNVAKAEAAKGELQGLKTEQASLQKQVQALEVARKAAEAQHQEAVAGHQRLTETLASMQRELDAARQEASSHATNFENSQKQLQALSAEQAVVLQQRGEAHKKLEEATRRLDEETRERKSLTEATDEARETAKLAKAETKACLKATVEHVRAITESFSLLRDGLYAFDSTKAVPDVWRMLVGQLGNTFGRAAIFLVRDNCLEGTESVGLDSKVNVKAISSPLTGDSILTRALREKTLVSLQSGLVGVFGQATEHAIAVPVFSMGRIVAVAYAEQPLVAGADAARTSGILAEALACHAGLCAAALQARKEAAEPKQSSKPQPVAAAHAAETPAPAAKKPIQFPGPARDAKRVVIRRGTEIVMDGVPGQLVDLSIGGAQVLLTQAVRPNQIVRLTLPLDTGQVVCKGRIVWAVFEQSRTSLAMYRAGLKFSEADAIAVESFMSAFQETPMARHQERTTSSGVA